MIDCGEGAQKMMQKQRLKFSRLRHIFLTHLHGDHFLGLPGLIETLNLTGCTGHVTIHTFAPGVKILQQIRNFFGYKLNYQLEFDIIEPKDKILLQTDTLTVSSIPLNHRVPTVGYLFEEQPLKRHLRPDMLEYHQVPVAYRTAIKQGSDYLRPDGRVIPNTQLTLAPRAPIRYAHISDTAYMPELAQRLHGVTCMMHEATYTHDLQALAYERGHSTAQQAALTAHDAQASKLILTHFSSRYNDETPLLQEAREIFAATELNYEGACFALD